MMWLKGRDGGWADVFVGEPIADGNVKNGDRGFSYDEEGKLSDCVFSEKYVVTVLGRSIREGEVVKVETKAVRS